MSPPRGRRPGRRGRRDATGAPIEVLRPSAAQASERNDEGTDTSTQEMTRDPAVTGDEIDPTFEPNSEPSELGEDEDGQVDPEGVAGRVDADVSGVGDREARGVPEEAGEPASGAAGPRTRGIGGVPGPIQRFVAAFGRLYAGQTRFNFVGRRRWWFGISTVIILAGIISFSIRGFNFGIDFKGGQSWTVQAPGISAAQATAAVQADGVAQPVVEVLGGKTLEVQADLNALPKAQQRVISAKVVGSLAHLAHTTRDNVSTTTVGPTWGGEVTHKALVALIAFFVVVAIYISLRFEYKMAIAALIAVVHDVLVAAGVYSLSGLQVTPDTVIAILTILGYSLYDTVVVFDRVRENTRSLGSSGRMTYSDMVNLSMNQTLARSLNTSLVAVLPVLAVLLIGAEILGATTLQEFGLALFIGLVSGAYSSIFIASPILAMLKEREPRYRTIRQRLATRGDRLDLLTPSAAAALAGAGSMAVRRSGRPGPPGRLRPAGTNGQGVAETLGTGRPPGASRSAATQAGRRPPRPRKGAKPKRRRR